MNPAKPTSEHLKFPSHYEPQSIISLYRERNTAGFSRDQQLGDVPVDHIRVRAREASNEKLVEIICACLDRTSETEIIEFLVETLNETKDRRVGVLCIMGLGQSNSGLAFKKIVDLLENPAHTEWLILAINLVEGFERGEETNQILVDLLNDDREKIKFYSAMILGRILNNNGEKLIDQLGSLLSDGCDSLTKYYILLVLKESSSEKAIALLENLMDENESFIPCFAIEILGEIGGEKAEQLIVPELESADPIRVFYAAEALGKVGNDRHWNRLVEPGRNHKDPNVRYYCLRSLYQIDPDRSASILLDSLEDDDQKIREFASCSLRQLGESIRFPYRQALASDDREAVNEALHVLGEIGEEEDLQVLLETTNSADKEIAQKAIVALKKMAADRQEARRLLLDRFSVAETDTKIDILRILDGHGNSELCSYLSKNLTMDDERLRYHLVGVCRNGHSPECLQLLGRLCQDENLQVASHAVQTLTSILNSESRIVLRERIVAEDRPLVLISYLRGIYLDRDSDFESVVVDVLRNTADRRVKYYAACALKAIQPDRLRHLTKNDPYLEKILDRIRVN